MGVGPAGILDFTQNKHQVKKWRELEFFVLEM